MKKIYPLLFAIVFTANHIYAQQLPPSVIWQKSFGGSKDDQANAIIKALDGGFIMVGSSKSNDGDVTGHHGSVKNTDAWVVKISASGDLEWQKSYGGDSADVFNNIIYTSDGNYVCYGSTYSNNGDVTGYHGATDLWVVKINRQGNIIWQRALGGSGGEIGGNIKEFSDGSLYTICSTTSNNGDVSGNHFLSPNNPTLDIWVAKLSANGNLLWQKCFGGTAQEQGFELIESFNKDFLMEVQIYSNDGDFGYVGSPPTPPSFLTRIDSAGNVKWLSHAGTGYPQQLTPFHQYIYINSSYIGCSPMQNNRAASQGRFKDDINNNYTGNGIGNYSFCAYPSPILVGYASQGASSMAVQDENSILFAAASDDTVANHGNHGGLDGFISRSSVANGKEWGKFVGGSGVDWFNSVTTIDDYSFIVAGYSNSNNGDVSGNHGGYDFWVVKMGSVNFVKGVVFADYNSNGIKDANEPYANNVMVQTKKTGAQYSSAVYNGAFVNSVDTGNFTTQLLISQPYYTSSPLSKNTSFTSFNNQDSIIFALQPIPGKRDYELSLYAFSAIRLGTTNNYSLYCINRGTDTLLNKKITLVKDHRLAFINAVPAPLSVSADTITWNLGSLPPRKDTFIVVQLKAGIPPQLNINDTLQSYALVDSTGDLTPNNNFSRLRQQVLSSLDPNDKQESNAGFLDKLDYDAGKKLNYTIRFQNTGNDTAFTVVVSDTLSQKLDSASIEMIGASHPYQFTIKDGIYCTWTFSHILLPDSNRNEPLSHGYITYSIKPRTGLAVGDTIRNSASIYFDYNLPVKTHTQVTVIKILPPPIPMVSGIQADYCSNSGLQKGKIDNMPTGNSITGVVVTLDTTTLAVGTDSTFGFNTNNLLAGAHTVVVTFTNAAGSKQSTNNFTVTAAAIPDVNLAANITNVLSLATTVTITATNASGGGATPKFIFARDRNFSNVLQAEGTANTVSIDPATLAIGENWIYVRMRTSASCFVIEFNTDSIKVTRDQSTGIIDPDNPGTVINVFPNPFGKQFYLTGLSSGKSYTIYLTTMEGQQVGKKEVINTTSTGVILQNVNAGVYLLSIYDNTKRKLLGSIKLFKQ